MVVYEFIYSDCIHESAAGTISIHRTKKGAEIAMEFHKESKRKEWLEDHIRCPELYDVFGKSEHWGIIETQLLE